MGTAMKNGGFRIRPLKAKERGFTYETFQVIGYLSGERVRKRFKSRELALGEKNRLEVLAANRDGGIQAVNTRLSREQIADAEAAIHRLAGKPLSEAVEWYLANYRPPAVAKPLSAAVVAFLEDRKARVEAKREVARVGSDDFQKVTNAMEDVNIAQDRFDEAKRKGAETSELELTLLAKIKDMRQIIADTEKRADDERNKALKDEAEQRQKTLDVLERTAEAIDRVANSQKSLADARHDALAFSLSDAAGGNRGTASDRARARAILRDEATARRLFDSSNTVDQFENGAHQQRGAQFFQNRALQLRGSFEKLTAADRDPFFGAKKELEQANTHLTAIERALAAVDTSKGSGLSPAPKSFAGK
jgi:hypothetical protein